MKEARKLQVIGAKYKLRQTETFENRVLVVHGLMHCGLSKPGVLEIWLLGLG